MLKTIYNSVYAKPMAVALAAAVLYMSFRMPPPSTVVLSAGTSIALETITEIKSDLVYVGEVIDFRVKYDVVAEDKVVIPAGSIAKGQVVRAQKAKGLGKEGFVEIQVKSVEAVDGQAVFLAGGNVYNQGDDKQTLAIVLGVLVCVLFLLLKGENATVPPGHEISASVASSLNIKV